MEAEQSVMQHFQRSDTDFKVFVVTKFHLLTFLLDSTKSQHNLTLTEGKKKTALKAVEKFHPNGVLPLIIKFLAKSTLFADSRSSEDILNTIKYLG